MNLASLHLPSIRPLRLLVIAIVVSMAAVACSSTTQIDDSTSSDTTISSGEDGVQEENPGPPPFTRITIAAETGTFLSQDVASRRASLCVNGGDSEPVVCLALADVALDLSNPDFGAELVDGDVWRLYDVDLTGELDNGKLSDITFESDAENGERYVCPDPTDGVYPTWRDINRVLRNWDLTDLGSTRDYAPSADQPFGITVFSIDWEAFEDICATAPGLRIDTLAVPVTGPHPASVPVPDGIDPAAPIAVFASELGDPAPEALLVGKLQIDQDCVYIQPTGDEERLLVLFSSAQTSWDPESNAILGGDGTGDFFAYVNGDKIEISGGFLAADRLNGTTWVLPPDPSCDTSRLWGGYTISR